MIVDFRPPRAAGTAAYHERPAGGRRLTGAAWSAYTGAAGTAAYHDRPAGGRRYTDTITRMLLYATLFLWSFLAATILPLGSEPALIGVVLKERAFLIPVLVATIGNYLGACTTYLIGRGLRRAVDHHRE